jgi:hypothetical protein
MKIEAEDLNHNHPDFDRYARKHDFIETSFLGEEDVKERAVDLDFLIVPESMANGFRGERTSPYVIRDHYAEANAYVQRARYPEVGLANVGIATGKAFSRDPEIKGDDVKPILDSLFADGADFQTGVTDLLTSYLKFGGGGLLVNPQGGEAVIHHYPASGLVNWNHRNGKLQLVVCEDDAPNASPFDHGKHEQRLVLGLDDDTGHYFSERWKSEHTTDDKGRTTGSHWVLDGERTQVSKHLKPMDKIPFIPIGGWKYKQPIFLPLLRTAAAYFSASAEYNHNMWNCAIGQAYISFGENGGWYGQDEFSAAGFGDDAGGAGEADPIEIVWGASTPLLLRDGEISFVSAPSGALSAQEKRLERLTQEMAGLGARAFKPMSHGNQTAETERLQQAGEGSMIHSAMRDVSKAVTLAVREAAEWRGIEGASDFVFRFNSAIHFQPLSISDVSYLVGWQQDGLLTKKHVRDAMRKVQIIDSEETDEEIDAQIEKEGALGGGFGDDEFDPNDPDSNVFDLGLGDDTDDDDDDALLA